MNRDKVLIEKLLEYLVEKLPDDVIFSQQIEIDGYEKEDIMYHIYLMNDAGFIQSTNLLDHLGNVSWNSAIFRVGWLGYECLEKIREERERSNRKSGSLPNRILGGIKRWLRKM